MDPSLDRLLDASAPPVATRTPDLQVLLREQVAGSRPTARRGRRSRVTIAALVAAGLVGVGAGASAAGVLPAPTWAPWYDDPAATHTQRISSGETCQVRYGVKAIEDPASTSAPAARRAALVEARDFVAHVDVAAIDVRRALRSVPATATAPDETTSERETFAVQYALQQRLDAHLDALGLPASAVAVSTAQTCDGGGS